MRGQGRSTRQQRRAESRKAAAAPPARSVLLVPAAFAVALLLVSLAPRVAGAALLAASFRGSALFVLAWSAVLFAAMVRTGATRSLHAVIRPQHWLQALVQLAVFAYWGYYWQPVYAHAWLLVGQILFAYAFDMLLAWSRRESYAIGFGPFPIIFSTNLFLWFRDDWFWLQFVMIGVGFLGKEFVRWQREGRRVHIFNPSAFSLGLFSLVLIVTGTTSLTWGFEIATTLTLAPRIYLFLFLAGLVVMYFFEITLIAGCAAAVLFGFSTLYYTATGVPYFIDSAIPAAVFLGLHLLVTDPSTSPRRPLGKAIFGALYGVGVIVLYAALGAVGAPTFYDKLLCVPLLNLSVQRIDALVRRIGEPATPVGAGAPAPARANLVYMTVWAGFFVVIAAMGGADGRHVGDALPFWQQACADGRRNACERLVQIETSYCNDNSAWACNELGGAYRAGTIVVADSERARGFFARACELRYKPGCFNLLDPQGFVNAQPRMLDLRLLLRERGRNLMETPEPELYARACEHGFEFACSRGRP